MPQIHKELFNGTLAGHEPGGVQYSPWLELAAGIVKTAADDYIMVLRELWHRSSRPDDVKKKRKLIVEKAELEGFFYSEWYDTLIDIDPEILMRQCMLAAKEKEMASIKRANKKKIRALLKAAE